MWVLVCFALLVAVVVVAAVVFVVVVTIVVVILVVWSLLLLLVVVAVVVAVGGAKKPVKLCKTRNKQHQQQTFAWYLPYIFSIQRQQTMEIEAD